jgi:PPOX class probable F420-dependent enzyme
MGQLTMTVGERDEFLAAVHIGVLAVERPDGPPVTAPIWYRYAPGGVVEFITGRESEKARLLERAGHASMCAQRETVPYAYVTVEGAVEFSDATDDARLDIATRYLGADLAAGYVASTAGADSLLVRLQPQRWRTTDYAKYRPGG